jgi:hypothetical protein
MLVCGCNEIRGTNRKNFQHKIHGTFIKSNSNSVYSRHILDTRHTYGTTEDIMDVVRIGRKGKYLNTLEKYYIHKIIRERLLMNDININEHNPIFDELQKIYDSVLSSIQASFSKLSFCILSNNKTLDYSATG